MIPNSNQFETIILSSWNISKLKNKIDKFINEIPNDKVLFSITLGVNFYRLPIALIVLKK